MSDIEQRMEELFDLNENKTNINTELIAGLTTFLATAYIIFVNPAILGGAFGYYYPEGEVPTNGLVTATVLVSAFSSIAMGVYAKNPIVLAPGMGLNAFFTYTVCAPWGMGIHPYIALGAVFWSGVIFILLSVFNIRTEIMRAIPSQLRYGVAIGIGLFLALLGFADHSNFIQHTPDDVGGVPIVVLGNMFDDTGSLPERLLSADSGMVVFIFGLALTSALVARRQTGALIIGILGTTAFAALFGRVLYPDEGIMVVMPDSLVAAPDFGLLFAIFQDQGAGIGLPIVESLKFAVLPAMFAFLFTDMFDSISTFVGVCEVGGLNDENGEPRNIKESLIVDGGSTFLSGLFGTSSGTSYIESAAGIEAGGRSGLTAVAAGILFLPFLFLSPVINMVPLAASAPILVLIGLFMCKPIKNINWDNFEDAFPAFMAMILIPLTYSITQGIIWGFLAYTAIRVVTGKADQISIPLWVINVFAILALIYAD